MAYTYWEENEPAHFGAPIFVFDAQAVVTFGKQLLICFDKHGVESGTDCPAPTNEIFSSFLKALYGAGFVTSDFDYQHFGHGPMQLLFLPGIAGLMAHSSNLSTMQMYLHTLARGHRMSFGYGGYPCFDHAYASGGLRALIERIEQYCLLARKRDWHHLQDDPELDFIQPVRV